MILLSSQPFAPSWPKEKMTNSAILSSLAEEYGFHLRLAERDLPHEAFSVCVATPSYEPEDRYRPFNARRDRAKRNLLYNTDLLRQAARRLTVNGLLFVYGVPAHLAQYGVALADELEFRYWIGVRATTAPASDRLRPEHTGLLVLAKSAAHINRLRLPHARCRYCNRTLKDWGGKSHLMHPEGAALSDVWMDIVVDSADRMPNQVFERILQLVHGAERNTIVWLAPPSLAQPQLPFFDQPTLTAFNPLGWCRPTSIAPIEPRVPEALLDRLHHAPCLQVLKAIPSATVDLAFADPPFNLMKNYQGYADNRAASDYLGWCKRWLIEYERVLKPGGAMVILNLPKWSVWLAEFLTRSKTLYLQNWIVWNALPEPKGLLMPAHYTLLYLTKGEQAARFHYCAMENGWQPFDEAVFPPDRADVCQRRNCVRARRASAGAWRGELTDIWYDIHRERLASRVRANRVAHPCRTPDRLLDRIIRLMTNPGDVVLDAFAGLGTSAMIARRLGRKFIAIEQHAEYLRDAQEQLLEPRGFITYPKTAPRRSRVSKRKLQLELQRLAQELGRLPTKADVEARACYSLESFEAAFASWGEALRAAKISLRAAPFEPIATDAVVDRRRAAREWEERVNGYGDEQKQGEEFRG